MSYQINLFYIYIYIFKLINDRIMMCTDLFFDSLNGLIFKILNTTHLHCLLFYIACIEETRDNPFEFKMDDHCHHYNETSQLSWKKKDN